ncbi:hypothetical protein RND81_08G097400 [Saponaria officinalis]|uniref:NAC domain-containing protein n=1 Tax=Saponaria officinalis TaxID=3572 RepID=A0AAW1J6X7_SAPOF
MENSMELDEQMELPPGFRFHPTDEELITHYLSEKFLDRNFNAIAIGEADLNKIEPWELPKKAKWGEKEWYFFCIRDRKYPTGQRTNRATEAGYWKATGKDKEIYRAKTLVGMKKTLVFYTGRAPKGEKSNWVMHEYRLHGKFPNNNLPKNVKNEWVISRVFEKNSGTKKPYDPRSITPEELHPSYLPPLMDSSPYDDPHETKVTCTTNDNSCHAAAYFSNPHHYNAAATTITTGDMASSSLLYSMKSSLAELEFVDSILAQDQPLLNLLLEGKTSIIKNEIGLNNGVDFSNHEMVHNNSSGQNNGLDCLWSY